ncbi:hypothetical protein EV363DRAFT_1397922 [Boletus edulis]|nr:hypothetical protein EV363DRAFT_1397922 [Boletus edulis]
MVYKDSETGDVTEAVLTVQGYVLRKELPPILSVPRKANTARYLRQAVTLTGLGTSAHTHLARNYPTGRVIPWKPEKFKGQDVLEISNRYLTSRHRQSSSPVVAFQHGVDPKNIISRLANDQYDHLEENQVRYYKLNEEYTKFETCDPSIFRSGDLVEVNFSIFAFPIDKENSLVDGGQSTVGHQSSTTVSHHTEELNGEQRAEIRQKTVTHTERNEASGSAPIVRKRSYYDGDESESVSQNLKRQARL